MPPKSKPVKKDALPSLFKPLKPVLFSDSTSSRPSLLVPNIRALSWSALGNSIATCTSAHIRVWNPERANVKQSLEVRNGHNGGFGGGVGGSGSSVEKIAFCPAVESVLASTGADGGVRLWDVRLPGGAAASGGKGTQLADVKIGEPGFFLTWHPHGTEMIVGTKEDTAHAIDVRRMTETFSTTSTWSMTSTPCTALNTKTTRLYNMAFSNSGRELFATTADGTVNILDWPTLQPLHTLAGHTQAVHAVQHSPRGDWVAVGGSDSIITLWDTHDWHCAHALTAHSSSIREVSFSWDGAYLVCGSGTDARDGQAGLEIWHADTGEVAHAFETSNPVTVAAWHPQRYWLAYAGDPGGLKIIGPGSNL